MNFEPPDPERHGTHSPENSHRQPNGFWTVRHGAFAIACLLFACAVYWLRDQTQNKVTIRNGLSVPLTNVVVIVGPPVTDPLIDPLAEIDPNHERVCLPNLTVCPGTVIHITFRGNRGDRIAVRHDFGGCSAPVRPRWGMRMLSDDDMSGSGILDTTSSLRECFDTISAWLPLPASWRE